MTRLLPILGAVLAVLIGADLWIDQHQKEMRLEAGTLLPLFDPADEVVPERIRRIEVRAPGGRHLWVYEKQGKIWRYPSYHGAYVQEDRVDFLLRSLLETYGTVVSGDDRDYGLLPQQAVEVLLAEDSGVLADVLVGRGAPGRRTGEAYVRRNRDGSRIRHQHANPRHALAGGNPPMLDPFLFPKVLERNTIVQINFASEKPAPRQLRRVPRPPPAEGPYLPRPGEYAYDWVATFDGGSDTCLTANLFAYTAFLKELRFESLRDPCAGGYSFSDSERIELTDEDGTVDVLHVGRREGDLVFVRNEAAGLVCAVDAGRAELLFPGHSALTDTLPEPSPYRLARQ